VKKIIVLLMVMIFLVGCSKVGGTDLSTKKYGENIECVSKRTDGSCSVERYYDSENNVACYIALNVGGIFCIDKFKGE